MSSRLKLRNEMLCHQGSWLRWLLGLWLVFCASGFAAAGIEVTPLPQLERADISTAWRICVTSAQTRLEQVVAGDCSELTQRGSKTAWGFDRRAFWMHLELVNTSDQPSQRVLTIGQPRMQEVSLFEFRGDQLVSRRESGISVPLADKPLAMTRPAFDLRFEPGEHKSLWLRVASQTSINLNTELFSPREAHYVELRLQFFETLALGLMLLCILYSLGSFLMQREKLMLYFSAFMAAELIIEVNRFGLMQLYLWPAHWALDPRVLGLGVILTLVSFTLVLQNFLSPIQRYKKAYAIYMLSIAVTLAGVGWSLVVDYRVGTEWFTLALIPVAVSVIGLSLIARNNGQKSANLLLQSFSLLLLVESLRIFSLLGRIDIDIGMLATPWAMALSTSFILINVQQRSAEMRAALVKSQNESDARLHFMSQMSHELRSPLTTMLGHLQLMKHEPLAPPVSSGIQAIWRDAKQLLAMIDDILDYAKGSLGHQSLHPVPRTWGQLVQHIRQSADILAQTKHNRLVWTEHGAKETPLLVDERRLQQVLNNLLTNAARYTHGGEIRLVCNLQQMRVTSPTAGWRLNFSVTDTGEGIAFEDQKRIFEPFQRGSKAHLSSHKGMGMGLAIASQLVRSMGGEMNLNSTPGQGSCFSFHVVCPQAIDEDFENLEDDHALIHQNEDDWQTDKNATTQADDAEPAEVFVRPADTQLATLKQLVDNGQLSDMLDWATALEQTSPELAAYCRRVRQAAMELDMPMLQSLSVVNAPGPSSAQPPPQPAAAP